MTILKTIRKPVVIISILLAVLPFFWIPPGTMDLGGDSSRLYFYDPLNYLKNVALYPIMPTGTGGVDPSYYLIPFVGLLWIAKFILGSPYLVVTLFNSFKLIIGFLAVFGIIKRLLEEQFSGNLNNPRVTISALIGALFYIFSPAMIANYDKALLGHNQVFLNPLMFYLLLKFFLDRSAVFLWLSLLVSVAFAPNFSYSGAPTFFSFYPLSLLYLLIYVRVIRRKYLSWKMALIGLVFFIGLHAFHLIPEIVQGLTRGNYLNTRLFDKNDIAQQLNYFFAVLPIPKLSSHFLAHEDVQWLGWASILVPFIVTIGFLLKKNTKGVALTGIFFLVTFFLANAKVTGLGVTLYSKLFYIPGFSMFRNFYGQFQFVYYFFYALLFGQTLGTLFLYLKRTYRYVAIIVTLFLVISSWQFINGVLINKVHHLSNNVRIAMRMDPQYEEMLAFLRSIDEEVRILTIPFTDFGYQVLHGLNNGAYVGPSTIGNLTGKSDFSGYATMVPYSDLFWKLSKEKDYESIKKMLGMLSVKYVFYNSDPLIYDEAFPDYPYSKDYVRRYMPNSQEGYLEYVKNITKDKIFERGRYALYSMDQRYVLPRFYIPRQAVLYDRNSKDTIFDNAETFFLLDRTRETRSIFLDRQTCDGIFERSICGQTLQQFSGLEPQIRFQKINPTNYKVTVVNARDPYMLVFSQEYQKSWRLSLASVDVGVNSHILVNGYANAWYITPADVGGKQDYELIVEMTGQRIFYYSAVLSIVTLVIMILWGVWRIIRKRIMIEKL
ncbi:MAG: hypothetical protein UU93_C0024G0004 [Candidatus Amesbacteria bacterium GW2011_GWA2_42_12]|uniref:Membrane protein 6-pyruvoyl-tetrahydropterin synthase-related domain-containing protein n=1 Tax=Candidatus Amesbacteria bacterium GW2011_GWA2_42_12 TaxID=1618356 RepID=A0A0G0Y2W4_9BACT|nr:MAG: hypothetical protein UU93_C0024G0004 [Candidatus Amesbacteria bacterium GW2011_GWA2_42_12]